MSRLRTLLLVTCFLAPLARAEVPGSTVKVGVLTDMSGPFSDPVLKVPSWLLRWGPKRPATSLQPDFLLESPGSSTQRSRYG